MEALKGDTSIITKKNDQRNANSLPSILLSKERKK